MTIDANRSDACPCGRGEAYRECCGPIHRGDPAPTAERLMRSRYSAFALGMTEYLLDSWDPGTRPASLELDEELTWRRLVVESSEAGGPFDREGTVTFTAVARVGASAPSATADRENASHGGTSTRRLVQRERSRFRRSAVDGRWRYVDGEPLDPQP